MEEKGGGRGGGNGRKYLEEILKYLFEVLVYKLVGCSVQCQKSIYSLNEIGSGDLVPRQLHSTRNTNTPSWWAEWVIV